VEERRRPVWLIVVGVAVLVAAIAVGGVLLLSGGDEAEAQTVRFQKPTDRGPDPFTRPTDVRGKKSVAVGKGPFGGTGSDLVRNRELLIRSLRARPERMREWARVVGVEPTQSAVARYIRKLRPVTLTRDTRVTNHSFVDGRAVGFQSILQAGTAVLVDKDGKPVARCRCGNPLAEPAVIDTAKCYGCPANYRPPPPCEYFDYDDGDYSSFDDVDYERDYDPRDYTGKCYRPYPDPPEVTATKRSRPRPEPAPATTPAEPAAPAAPAEPRLNCDAPRSQAEFEQCHPPQQAPEEAPTQTQQEGPPPGFECPDQPPAHPGEDYLRYCG
jgi:hypothetical protein